MLDEEFSNDRFSDLTEARKKAMDYLARREYGRTELIDKLTRFGFAAHTADDAVAQLAAENLQSDQRFVEAFVVSRINQGKGPVRIRAELRERRVPGSIVEQGLDQAGQDWYESARSVREKKFGHDLPGSFNEKARQMRFLQARGFDTEHIQSAVSA
jgi:regulatory protein